jgi:polyisoprenoid-binding protein YceI
MTVQQRCRILVLAVAVVAAMSLPAVAQTNASHSAIAIQVHKSGFFSAFAHDHVVVAPIAQGALDTKAMKIDVTVATKQVKVTDPEVSEKDRAEIQSTMLGPKVLDAEKFPQIRFHSSRVEPLGPQRYRVTGELELHGTTRPLSFDVTGGPDHYQGKTKFKQTDFGIQPVSVAGGTVKVKDEVEIEISVYSADLAPSAHPGERSSLR